MRGSVCLWQVLKAEEANLLRMYSFKMGKFSAVGAQGRAGSSVGGKLRVGHEQGGVPSLIMPVFVHLGKDGLTGACWLEEIAAESSGGGSSRLGEQDPTRGNCAGTTWSAIQASRLMYTLLTALLMYSSWRVDILCPEDVIPVTSTITPPRSVIGSDDAPSILDWRGRMESLWIPSSANRDSGPTTI